MRRTVTVTTLALCAALASVTACGPEGSPAPLAPERLDASAASPDAGLAATEGVAESAGGVVTFDETLAFFFHFDAARGLMAIHGAVVELCQGQPLSTTSRLIARTPSKISQTLFKIGEKEQPVVIYRTDTGAISCGLVNSPEVRVAAGMVSHQQVFTLASFTARWVGNVVAPDGSTRHLTENFQLTADIHDPNNPALWSVNTSNIRLQ